MKGAAVTDYWTFLIREGIGHNQPHDGYFIQIANIHTIYTKKF